MEEEVEYEDSQLDSFSDDLIFGSNKSFYDEDETTEDETEKPTEESSTDQTEEVDSNAPNVESTSGDIGSIFELKGQYRNDFKSDAERADYYKTIVDKTGTEISSLKDRFLEAYKEDILAVEQDAERLKEIAQAMNGDPNTFLRKYFGNQLQQMGYNLKYSDSDINRITYERLSQKFGEDWEEKFDPNHLKTPTSLASQIRREQDKIYNELMAENEQYNRPMQQSNQPDPELVKRYVDEQYTEFKQMGMARNDYDEFVNTASNYQMTMQDLYKVIHFQDIVQHVKTLAKQEVYNEIKQGGGKEVKPAPTSTSRSDSSKADILTMADFYKNKKATNF